MNIESYFATLAHKAKTASRALLKADFANKNCMLEVLYHELLAAKTLIIAENSKDLEQAQIQGRDSAFIDRLMLDEPRINTMAEGVRAMVDLKDPIGEITEVTMRPSGIEVGKMRVPLGVIGIIYEARPNVTIDAAALCLKAGNAAILRGGSEAFYSNQILARIIQKALVESGLPEDAVQVINNTERVIVDYMITAKNFIDVIIPRGGKSLIARIDAKATVPVIKHLDGICHTFVDESADIAKALLVCDNAKTQRYAPCNTMETLLVHRAIAEAFLPQMAKLYQTKGVELRTCTAGTEILQQYNIDSVAADEDDWSTEYLAPIIAIKIVASMDEAIEHINHYGSHHTDVILSEHFSRIQTFLRLVDSACVMVNASSRFCDGFEFGLGAEIGISTDKLHARGPVGLEGLTSLKYIVLGHGEIRG